MKPIRLELEAFGPYLDPVTIEFDKLNEAGLFLISGSTGGGKTTLLDAMCIALYNTSTGGRRSFSDMRSLSAEREQRTEVTFTFSLGEQQYRFHRALYMRKKRGSEVYDLHEQHECYCLENETWTLKASGAARNVTEYAQNLLSLKADQFSQVIVLPQGEFLRLLRANSKDKGEILKTLFACESWKTLVAKLGDRQKAVSEKRKTLDTTLKSLLKKHDADTPETLDEQIAAFGQSILEIETKLTAENEGFRTAQTLLEQTRRYEQLCKDLQLAEKEHTLAQQKHTAAEQAVQQNAVLTQVIGQLDQDLLNAERRGESLKQERTRSLEKQNTAEELLKAQKRLAQLQKEQTTADAVHRETAERILRGEAFLEEINRAAEALPGLIQQKNDLELQRRAAIECEEFRRETDAAKKELEISEQKALQEKLAVSAQDKLIAAAEAAQKADHAAALAASLEDGVPCPVCGAVHHPSPALRGEAVISEAELQAMRRHLEDLRRTWTAAENAVSAARTKLELSASRLRKAESACGPDRKTVDELQNILKPLILQIDKLQKTASKAAEARQKLQVLRSQNEKAEATRSECTAQRAAVTAELEQLEIRLRSFDSIRDIAEIDREVKALTAQIQAWNIQRATLQTQQRTAAEALAAAKELCSAAEGRLNAAKEAHAAFGPAPSETAAAVSERIAQIQSRIHAMSVTLGSTREALASAKKSAAEIHVLSKEAEQLDLDYSRITRLHGFLSGQKNTLRMPILQYVLSMMLEETIFSANRYLTIFSRGRYALRRMQAPKSGAGYSGLDIEVLDGMSGTCRSIETLSGGEQFLASLSLAFGLSEVVQANSGVVRMDSIFIDEGFGSLDGDTLDTAMKALEIIRQSGRVVGIISHVSELRHRIPTMIRVSHKDNGSAKATVISE